MIGSALAMAAGCTTTATARDPAPGQSIWVRDIRLDTVRGEVGRPFKSRLTWNDNYIEEPEFDVDGLPPGLRFDPATRAITGTPRRAGFFTVNVAIRKRVPPSSTHRPKPDERWWPASFEFEIYRPMTD